MVPELSQGDNTGELHLRNIFTAATLASFTFVTIKINKTEHEREFNEYARDAGNNANGWPEWSQSGSILVP